MTASVETDSAVGEDSGTRLIAAVRSAAAVQAATLSISVREAAAPV